MNQKEWNEIVEVLRSKPDFSAENMLRVRRALARYPSLKDAIDVLKRYKPK